jgi:hypothetical protein
VDHLELVVQVVPEADGREKGPKIAQSSCGNVTLRENAPWPNFTRIFLLEDEEVEAVGIGQHGERRNISFKIEGKR